MKLIVVAIIAAIVLMELASLTYGCECGCAPCGPGGKACNGCPERDQLCQDLVKIVRELQIRVRQCVCGEPEWLL